MVIPSCNLNEVKTMSDVYNFYSRPSAKMLQFQNVDTMNLPKNLKFGHWKDKKAIQEDRDEFVSRRLPRLRCS